MGAINLVVAGDYQDQRIKVLRGRMFIGDTEINKGTIERYEIMNENSSTTSFTKGKTKKSMVGAGTKGAVGAVVGSVFGPVGTIIGAGAGVATSKGKTKSVTKEVTNKEITVAIFFVNGKQSLVKMDGKTYEEFLIRAFSEPLPHKLAKQKDSSKNNQALKVIGWIIIPYIMVLANWRNLANPYRIAGIIWSVIAVTGAFLGR